MISRVMPQAADYRRLFSRVPGLFDENVAKAEAV